MSIPDTPSARHLTVAADFAAVADQVTDWNAPSPVPEWTALDVVSHLITWLPPVLEQFADLSMTKDPAKTGADVPAAFRNHSESVQDILDNSSLADRKVATGPFAGSTVSEMIDRIYTSDVFMHSSDLARSTGVHAHLDPGYCEMLLLGMTEIEDLLRSSGQYGPAFQVSEEASAEARLMAFCGRDPEWTSPLHD